MAGEPVQEASKRPDDSAAAPKGLQPENRLEADDDLNDNDSTFDTAEASSSYLSSLKSSIFSYRYENGRRYHAFREGSYPLPNDDEEQNRMDLVHHIYSLFLGGKLHLAPIGEHPHRVLDIGTGTGLWAMDFADEHSSAEVIGTDLSPIQPHWIPPNCIFEVDDFEDQWTYKKPFDFIHGRELEGCIADETRLFQQAFQNLVSGGYVELQAMRACFMSDDGTLEKATNAERWAQTLRDSSTKFGKPIDSVPGWKDKLSEAGFVDIHQEVRKVPIGAWPKDPVLKEIGRCQAVQSLQAVESYTPVLFGKVLGWQLEEIQVLMAQVKKELRDPSIHLYIPIYFIWAKKP